MKIRTLFIIYFASIGNLFSQIDTTEIYPLQIGNYWEYLDQIQIFDPAHYYDQVIGTKVLQNGKTYAQIESASIPDGSISYEYIRVENNAKVYRGHEEWGEELVYDSTIPVGGMFLNQLVISKERYYSSLFQDSLLFTHLADVWIDSSYTPPDTGYSMIYQEYANGVGPYTFGWDMGRNQLKAAIINGKQYGNVSVEPKEPLIYLPLKIGNQWTYKVFDVNVWENDTSDTYYYRTDEVVSETVLNDGYKYFEIRHGGMSSYYLRIDSVTNIIYDPSGYEFYNLGVNPDSLWVDNGGMTNNMYYDTSRVGELDIIRPMMVYQQGSFLFNRTLAKGIGLSFQESGDLGLHTLKILVYAKIDGVKYGDIDTSQQTDFFPLQIGNRWQYSEGLGEVLESKAIGDTTMSNSLTYIKVQGVFFSGCFRKEDSRIYSYDTVLNEEELIYDFSLKIGDTLSVKVFDQDTIVTTVSSEGITTIFGEDRKYMTFFSDEINSSGDFERKVVGSIGFAEFSGEMFFYGLTGAVIDGVSHGNIVNVENPNESIPNEYFLRQNYPNPFNPSTTIKYSIPSVGTRHASLVQLKVYDILGCEVTTLVSKAQKPGNYEVQFDASNLTSGLYFYRIATNGFTKTMKMILLK